MGCPEEGGDSCGEWGGGAGSHRLDVLGVAEIEAAVGVVLVGGEAIDGVGFAVAACASDPAADSGVVACGITAAGSGQGVEGGAEVAVIGEGDGAGGAGGSGGGVLGAGWVGGGHDGEDVARLGGELDISGVGEIEAVVSGRGDEDDVGLVGGIGDLVEGGEEAGAVSGGEVGEGSYGEGDDIGAIGDGVVDALDDPTEKAAGFSGFALVGGVGVSGYGGRHALEDFDVEDGGLGSYSDDLAGSWADGSGGEGGGPGAVAGLVLRCAVVAGCGISGLVDLGQVEGEIWGDVGVRLVDAAVEDGDADAASHGGVPWTVRGASGDVRSVAADLLDGPTLRGGVVGVVGWRWCDDRRLLGEGAVGGETAC